MRTKTLSRLLFIVLVTAISVLAQTARHPLKLDDLVGDPLLTQSPRAGDEFVEHLGDVALRCSSARTPMSIA